MVGVGGGGLSRGKERPFRVHVGRSERLIGATWFNPVGGFWRGREMTI